MLISREEFRDIYKGVPSVLDKEHIFYNKPKDYNDLLQNYFSSRLWRLNNIYSIVSADAEKIPFKMRAAQHKIWANTLRHPRQIILKSRQQGISTLFLVLGFDMVLTNDNFKVGLLAQGEEESTKLLERTKFLWDSLDEDIKGFLNLERVNNSQKEFSFSNGSTVFIRTSFRSTTLNFLHVSEMGKIAATSPKKAVELVRGTFQALTKVKDSIIAVESTSEGQNMFKDMFYAAYNHKGEMSRYTFGYSFLPWQDDVENVLDEYVKPSVEEEDYFDNLEKQTGTQLTQEQKNFYITKKAEVGSQGMLQEYPGTVEEAFARDLGGTYYSKIYINDVRNTGKEVDNLFEPGLSVHTACDMGMSDLFCVVFFQCFQGKIRIINEFADNGKNIKDICRMLDDMRDNLGYVYGTHFLPHDANVRELGVENQQSRAEIFGSYGHKNYTVLLKSKNVATEIELVRKAIPRMHVDKRCKFIINTFLNYRRKWDARRQIHGDVPEHDEFSHMADAIRYMVGGIAYLSPIERKIPKAKTKWSQGFHYQGNKEPFGYSMDL